MGASTGLFSSVQFSPVLFCFVLHLPGRPTASSWLAPPCSLFSTEATGSPRALSSLPPRRQLRTLLLPLLPLLLLVLLVLLVLLLMIVVVAAAAATMNPLPAGAAAVR